VLNARRDALGGGGDVIWKGREGERRRRRV